MTNWYTVAGEDAQERLLAAWGDAPIENLETLGMILSTARRQVITYAPKPAEGVDVDDVDYRPDDALAQLNFSVDLWNAGRTDANGNTGAEGFIYKPLALSKEVKRIIRPVDGRPSVF